MTLLEQIGTAAIEWEAARRDVLRLKEERNAFACEEAESYTDACWQKHVGPEGNFMPLEKRCGPCQQSHAAHKLVAIAIVAGGVKLRRLRRLIAKLAPAQGSRRMTPCPWYQHWWHRRLRQFDRWLLFRFVCRRVAHPHRFDVWHLLTKDTAYFRCPCGRQEVTERVLHALRESEPAHEQ